MVELHTKEHVRTCLQHENDTAAARRFDPNISAKMLSEFGDKNHYAGMVLTGFYISSVYKLFHLTIADHFSQEVKKRGALRLQWDASFKECKHLARYHGESVFRALITATHEIGEIRIQFHVVTDGHDQMYCAVATFIATCEKYGQGTPQLLTTDKPGDDKPTFLGLLPGLRATQEKLDRFATQQATGGTGLPVCTTESTNFKVLRSALEINANIDCIRNQLLALPRNLQVMSIDAEWDTFKNLRGCIVGSGPAAVVQLGYRLTPEGPVQALVMQLHGRKSLPDRLAALFATPGINFIGRDVGGDLKRIGRDFKCYAAMCKVKLYTDIGIMARTQDVVLTGVVSLQTLVELVLGEKLLKTKVRVSKWSATKLSDEQALYAALDVIKPLEVYFKLDSKPDLTARFSAADAVAGVFADVVPQRSSSVSTMATRAAVAVIEESVSTWASPIWCKPAQVSVLQSMRRVTVTEVLAPFMVVPGMKRDGKPICLADFGAVPFDVFLPLTMLKHHVHWKLFV